MSKRVFGWAIVPVLAALAMPAVSSAATTAYSTAVLANSPYAYFRQGETAITTGTMADSIDTPANRDGVYQGTPTGGVAGAGVGTDNAVTYAGTTADNVAAAQFFGGPNLRSFGSSLGTSSYEFVFKYTAGQTTATRQSLFGVFNTGSTTAVEVTLNSRGNDAFGAIANDTRLFFRGDDGDAVGVTLVNSRLYDGLYHQLVFTYDNSQVGLAAFKGYVDGVAQTLTLDQVGTTATDADTDPDGFSAFAFDPTFAARNVRGTFGAAGTAINRQLNGTIDEAVLYTSVLTPEQVATNFAALGIPEPTSLAALALGGLVLRRRRQA